MKNALVTLFSPRFLPQLIAGSAALVLIVVHIFEYGFGYLPCQLCLYQRLPWWAALGLGCIAALLIRQRPTLAFLISLLALFVILVGAGLGGYHAGVEYGFWQGPTGCSGAQDLSSGLTSAIQQVESGPAGPSCGEVVWSLFGISMAGYNMLISLGLVALGGWIIQSARKANR